MRRSEILATVCALLRGELGVRAEVAPESELAADLGLDSLKLMTLVVELENAFRVVLEPEGEAPPVTVGDVVALVERGLAGAGAAA